MSVKQSMNDAVCGSELYNPFCLPGGPTDPYAWVFLPSSQYYYQNGYYTEGGHWRYATQWSANGGSSGAYGPNDIVQFSGPKTGPNPGPRLYVCNYTTGSGPALGCSGQPGQPNTGWQLLTDVLGADHIECTGPNQPPMPDPQSGTCLKSPLDGPEAACVNPCIRLANGQLVVNKNANQCRVFPGATEGGSASTVSGLQQCTTVCPQECVELWASCPPGTAPLTTLIQTKSPVDLLALTSPYRLDGTPNPNWPANYAQNNGGAAAIGGKPYIECYSYNTEFCELPGAWMETTAGPSGAVAQCYANCPAGTFPDPSNSKVCLFVPTDGSQFVPGSQNTYSPTTPVQRVFCNPQYFNPAYWSFLEYPQYAGVQKGCEALPLPTKQGSTCPQGTLPIINENFNLEWCLPECPTGYFSDLTQSTCVATCEGLGRKPNDAPLTTSGPVTAYNRFLDYVDFYATTGRCDDKDCVQDLSNGRCPATQDLPHTSNALIYKTTDSAPDVLMDYRSMNTQCAAKLHKDFRQTNGATGINKSALAQIVAQRDAVKAYQTSYPQGPSALSKHYGTRAAAQGYPKCPPGMVQGSEACSEDPSLCYDECISGYEPVVMCRSGAQTCEGPDKVFACRAMCPAPEEGLGPWAEVNADPLFTCAYQYPSGTPPVNPNLWVPCPEDGRYTILQSSPTDVAVSLAEASARQQPLCVRKTYLRQSTCPMSMNPVSDPVTGLTQCIAACNASDIVVTLPDGTVVCQSVPEPDARFEMDLIAAVDRKSVKQAFHHRVMVRKNILRGQGFDPNIGLPDNTLKPEASWISWVKYGFIGIIVILTLALVVPKKK